MKRASLPGVAFMLCAAAAPAQQRYFPADTARDSRHAAFREEWFGQRLRAMEEPVLSGVNGRAGYTRRLRLLVRPYRRPPYAIRIDVGVRRSRLSFVELDTAAYDRPAHVARRRVFVLNRGQSTQIGAALDQASLASLPAYAPARPPRLLPDGRQEVETCVHSTHFVLELVDEAGAHLVERDPCNLTPEVAVLADRLIALRPRGGEDDRAVLAEQMRSRNRLRKP